MILRSKARAAAGAPKAEDYLSDIFTVLEEIADTLRDIRDTLYKIEEEK